MKKMFQRCMRDGLGGLVLMTVVFVFAVSASGCIDASVRDYNLNTVILDQAGADNAELLKKLLSEGDVNIVIAPSAPATATLEGGIHANEGKLISPMARNSINLYINLAAKVDKPKKYDINTTMVPVAAGAPSTVGVAPIQIE